MKSAPRVTVVVPLYNKAASVERALASIAGQTLTDFEALIVDDGSTDESADIAAAFPDARFQLVRQPNRGPGAARNRGLALAQSEIVAFLDADDAWLPEYLDWAVDALCQTPEAAACACSYFEAAGSKELSWRARDLTEGVFRATPDLSPERFTHTLAFLSPCTTVARAEALRRWGGFYDRSRCLYGEDAFLWLKVLLNETVFLDLQPRVRIHREASDLSNTRRTLRDLEPFLEYPEEIRANCPAPLQPLLDSFLTLRAFKTACVWSYWGRWREARRLRERFQAHQRYRLPYFWPSLLSATPAGALAGWLCRRLFS